MKNPPKIYGIKRKPKTELIINTTEPITTTLKEMTEAICSGDNENIVDLIVLDSGGDLVRGRIDFELPKSDKFEYGQSVLTTDDFNKPKRLVCARADDRISEYTKITHPIMQKAASDWGADFCLLNNPNYDVTPGYFSHYRIMEIYDLFNKYDTILNLDSDMLIMKCCPNPFEKFNENKIYSIYEDKGSRQEDRRKKIQMVQNKFKYKIDWTEGYINDGFLLINKDQRDIFLPIKGEVYEGSGQDDVFFSYQIKRLELPFEEIDWRFNAIGMFFENWNSDNGLKHRLTEPGINIVHAAGYGCTEEGIHKKTKYIKELHKKFNELGLLYGS